MSLKSSDHGVGWKRSQGDGRSNRAFPWYIRNYIDMFVTKGPWAS